MSGVRPAPQRIRGGLASGCAVLAGHEVDAHRASGSSSGPRPGSRSTWRDAFLIRSAGGTRRRGPVARSPAIMNCLAATAPRGPHEPSWQPVRGHRRQRSQPSTGPTPRHADHALFTPAAEPNMTDIRHMSMCPLYQRVYCVGTPENTSYACRCGMLCRRASQQASRLAVE